MKTLTLIVLLFTTILCGQTDIKFDTTKTEWVWQKDLPKNTTEAWVFESDILFQNGTILAAYRYKTKTNYLCYDIFAQAFIGMWDEYSEECYEEWIHKEPTISGFVEYLRRKIK